MQRPASKSQLTAILITDIGAYGEHGTVARADEWCKGQAPGTIMVQLRDKAMSAQRRLRVGTRLRRITARQHQFFVVNDRLDLAALLEADGVHLGDESVSTADARKLLGESAWVSRAYHERPDACREAGVDAFLVSPVFAPRKGRLALGLDGLRTACDQLQRARAARNESPPLVFALGGAEWRDVLACRAVGGAGVAMIGGAWGQRAANK